MALVPIVRGFVRWLQHSGETSVNDPKIKGSGQRTQYSSYGKFAFLVADPGQWYESGAISRNENSSGAMLSSEKLPVNEHERFDGIEYTVYLCCEGCGGTNCACSGTEYEYLLLDTQIISLSRAEVPCGN
ncbi:hypothetical protein AVEN_1939-1 [Araneus ventricosus]|uniref:Uncharacterized protein n=1 Tax=Araneus ventricosus TaxID=182803 RepID=A0A4Y2GAB2_ARAVE|nr:hypothetical protein AVEN_1939-1 [Araneus ventricosus]